MSEPIREFDLRANADWVRLGWTAASRPVVTIEAIEVPDRFQPLIPFAERWGINCDVRRGDHFEQQSAADIEQLYCAVRPHWEALNAWVDEPPSTTAKGAFMLLLKAYSEAVPPPSAEEIAANRLRLAAARPGRHQHR
jgi:hypothetical protein